MKQVYFGLLINAPAQSLHATHVGTWGFKHPADKLSRNTSAWHLHVINIFKADSTKKKKKSFLENQFTRGLLISKLHPEFQKCSRHYTALGNTLLLTLVRLEAPLNVKEAQYLLRQRFSHDCQMWLLSTDDSQSRKLASQDFWKIQPKTVTCF